MNQIKLLQYSGILIFLVQISYSQVGIGTTSPTSTLDIVATDPTGTATTVDGIIIPRVDRERAQSMMSITTSTMIYVNSIATGTATGTAANITSIGFYYYDGSLWQKIVTGKTNWELTGNTGTTAGTNFIGTTDAQDFRIKTGIGGIDRWNISNTNNGQLQSYSLGSAALPTFSWQTDPNTGLFSPSADVLATSTNGNERMRIEADGDVGIGTSAASYKLSVRHDQDGYGVMSVDNATSGGFSGVYFMQNTAYRGHIGYVNTGGVSTFGGKGFYQLASGDRPMVFSVGTVGSELFLERMRIDQIGNVGIGLVPTAKLTLAAGTATANTAPLKFTSGTNLTTPESGAIEYDGINYFATSGGIRYTLAKVLTGSAVINFGTLNDDASNALTSNITVTGAQIGDPVIIGLPNNVMDSNSERGADYQAWVSATDTVTIRFLNPTQNTCNPDSGTFKVTVFRY